jgi:hypothetical protein
MNHAPRDDAAGQDGKPMGPELDAILVDAQQCLGLVPRDVPTARIFVQGLIGVRPRLSNLESRWGI